MKNKNRQSRLAERLPAVVVTAAIFIIWQAAAMLINMQHILPSPADIAIKIWELKESLFLHHMPSTLVTIFTGWGISIIIGVLLAMLMHFSEYANAALLPVMTVTQTIPILCISPLFVLWLGYTLGARLLAVVLSTFFAIALNTYDGFRSADIKKKEYMRTCGAGKGEIFWKLEVPSALPKFMTALKMTLPWAVIDGAVAEWLGATEGLGYFSKRMISKMDGAAVFAPVVILCIIALVGMAVIKHTDRKHVHWRSEV